MLTVAHKHKMQCSCVSLETDDSHGRKYIGMIFRCSKVIDVLDALVIRKGL